MRGRRVLVALVLAGVGLGGCAGDGGRRSVDRRGANEVAEQRQRLEEAERRGEELAQQATAIAQRDPQRAVELYREAVRSWPRLSGAWNNMGVLLMESGDHRAANDAFLIAAENAPWDPRPLQNLGVLKMRVGWNDQAFSHFLEALERDPNHVPSLVGAAEAAFMLQRADERVLEIIRRAQLHPTSPDTNAWLARQRLVVEQQLTERR